MAGNPRHPSVTHMKTGVKRDGTLVAHEAEIYFNSGAYSGYKPAGVIGGGQHAGGPYRTPHVRVNVHHVYTNTVHGGHMRSPGDPQAVFAVESQMDEVARRLGMDPLEFRMKNLIEDGDETLAGHVHLDLKGRETLQAAVEAADYGLTKPLFVGRGIAIGDRPPGGGESHAAVTFELDGSIVLSTPIFEQGTGTYTTLRQVVAEELGAPFEQVRVKVWNTDAVPFDSGIGGSRVTRVGGTVAYEAAQEARRALLQTAAESLGWPETQMLLDGHLLRRTDTEERKPWLEVLAQMGQSVTGRANFKDAKRAEVTSFVAQVAEVSVDPETGQVELLRFTTAHDVGTILNPVGHQGQIDGGVVQGIGYALMEELKVEDGRVTTLSFADNKIPTTKDLPLMQTVLVPSESGVGPYQTKGIGENPIIPVAAAIANAVEDAAGIRIRDLPVTAEKVYRALKAKEQGT